MTSHRHGGYEYQGAWRPNAAWNGVHTCWECRYFAAMAEEFGMEVWW